MKVHADVLRMAKTKEKRERIKWFHARTVFFGEHGVGRADEGLALARECDHEDARFLLSLFPDDAPKTSEEVVARFLEKNEDARCLCWAAMAGNRNTTSLLAKSAQLGYAWAQANWLWRAPGSLELLEKAVAQGECKAFFSLGLRLWFGDDAVQDQVRGGALLREAAALGHAEAQYQMAMTCCKRDTLERVQWLRRAAIQGHHYAYNSLLCEAPAANLGRGGLAGRIAFEIGAALATVEKGGQKSSQKANQAKEVVQLILLFDQSCNQARRAVIWWMCYARKEGVAKDIRVLIADLIWDERAAWCERRLR